MSGVIYIFDSSRLARSLLGVAVLIALRDIGDNRILTPVGILLKGADSPPLLNPRDYCLPVRDRIHFNRHMCMYRHLFRFERMKIGKRARSFNIKKQLGANKQRERQLQRRKTIRQNRSRYKF